MPGIRLLSIKSRSLNHLAEEYDECGIDIAELQVKIQENNAVVDGESLSEACEAYANAEASTRKFIADDYDSWSIKIQSYLTQVGYACAFTFTFCVVQVGASYYITKTSSELQE